MAGQGGILDLIHSVLLTPVLYKGQSRWYLLKGSIHRISFCNNAVPCSPSSAFKKCVFCVCDIVAEGYKY